MVEDACLIDARHDEQPSSTLGVMCFRTPPVRSPAAASPAAPAPAAAAASPWLSPRMPRSWGSWAPPGIHGYPTLREESEEEQRRASEAGDSAAGDEGWQGMAGSYRLLPSPESEAAKLPPTGLPPAQHGPRQRAEAAAAVSSPAMQSPATASASSRRPPCRVPASPRSTPRPAPASYTPPMKASAPRSPAASEPHRSPLLRTPQRGVAGTASPPTSPRASRRPPLQTPSMAACRSPCAGAASTSSVVAAALAQSASPVPDMSRCRSQSPGKTSSTAASRPQMKTGLAPQRRPMPQPRQGSTLRPPQLQQAARKRTPSPPSGVMRDRPQSARKPGSAGGRAGSHVSSSSSRHTGGAASGVSSSLAATARAVQDEQKEAQGTERIADAALKKSRQLLEEMSRCDVSYVSLRKSHSDLEVLEPDWRAEFPYDDEDGCSPSAASSSTLSTRISAAPLLMGQSGRTASELLRALADVERLLKARPSLGSHIAGGGSSSTSVSSTTVPSPLMSSPSVSSLPAAGSCSSTVRQLEASAPPNEPPLADYVERLCDMLQGLAGDLRRRGASNCRGQEPRPDHEDDRREWPFIVTAADLEEGPSMMEDLFGIEEPREQATLPTAAFRCEGLAGPTAEEVEAAAAAARDLQRLLALRAFPGSGSVGSFCFGRNSCGSTTASSCEEELESTGTLEQICSGALPTRSTSGRDGSQSSSKVMTCSNVPPYSILGEGMGTGAGSVSSTISMFAGSSRQGVAVRRSAML
eukprot:TRINITY_DN40604_c0_g1_i1.p1 TRINITY_DN40604_c0_g1~~TRINITY_DN40604_c0_g1_i1.p1  ORF type:complete len:754 (-),score=137.87 TRINITY_DN40604_c0_g1_i1:312-2573(-)